MMQSKRKDDDVEDDVSPFADLRKNVVLRESSIFHDRELNASNCARVLTKLLYLLSHGETLSTEESVEIFFAVTKLFQSPDPHLRRLIYLMIKELRVSSDSSLIVVSCLSKDMTSKSDLFRANSIRVLSVIMDSSMVGQMERFLKQAIVDKNPFIMAAALAAGQQLYNTSPDTIKRWVNEIQEALNNKSRMVQYHALALLYRIRSADKLALSKIVTSLARHSPSISGSPYAQILHLRLITQLLLTQSSNSSSAANAVITNELLKYVSECFHAANYLVMYEASRCALRLAEANIIPSQSLDPAISVLQEMLSSSLSAHRFAAVKTLSEVVVRFPLLVSASVVVDLERLITDPNRSIATLAITTLLKTGVESNVDRLMKSISGFMAEISDEFKIVLVEAIRSLCLKFPHKFPSLLNFLNASLREEGGFKYKKAIVDAMLVIIGEIKEANEMGLEHFCEFIEDCEFPELSVRILSLLGEKGPQTSNPQKYIRYIFNRVILETASVRCAAVSSLAKFGSSVPALTENIVVLLNRCLNDNDDEVRDRAVLYVNMLTNEKSLAKSLLTSKPIAPLHQLEASLVKYIHRQPPHPFSISQDLVMVGEDPDKLDEAKENGGLAAIASKDKSNNHNNNDQINPNSLSNPSSTNNNPHLSLLQSIPELAALGTLFKSCSPISLTEAESEYVVTAIKHIYSRHVLFQFNVTNQMENHLLTDVRVMMECENNDWQEDMTIPESSIPYQIAGVTFVAFTRPNESFISNSINCTLQFKVKEVEEGDDLTTVDGGSSDEYQLEDIEVSESDFMSAGNQVGLVEFKRQWEDMGDTVEVVRKYSLGLDSLQSAVSAVMELLGMSACEQSGVVPEGVRSHAVNLTGTFFPDIAILARAGFMLDSRHGVTLKIAVRSHNQMVNNMLTNAIR